MLLPFSSQGLRRGIAAIGLLALSTCAGLDNIDVETGGTATVPAATIIDKLLGGALDFAGMDKIDFTQEFENQGVSKDDVDSVRLSSMTLSIESPATGNFDFLQRIEFFAQASGLPKVPIASMVEVPAGATKLTLTLSDAELKPYVVAPSMQIVSQVEGARPDQETRIRADVVLDVDITVPGCE